MSIETSALNTATSSVPLASRVVCVLSLRSGLLLGAFAIIAWLSLIVVINLLNRSFQGFDAGVAVDTPDRLIPIFTSRYCHSTIGIAVVLSVLV